MSQQHGGGSWAGGARPTLLLLLLSCSSALLCAEASHHHHHVHLRRRRLTTQAALLASKGSQPMRRVAQEVTATASKGYCAVEVAGAPAPFNTTAANATMVTCLEFHNSSTPLIHVPADTATIKYGQIVGNGPFAVYDRDNKNYPISDSANPPTSVSEVKQVWSHVVVNATVDPSTGIVTSFTPLIYVLDSAVLKEFVESQYVATLTPSPLIEGAPPSSWVRWSFLGNISNTSSALVGSFDNLYHSVKDADGVCQPALCSDPTKESPACQTYGTLFSPNVTLVWDAQVFFPGVSGSQLGAFLALSSAGVTYVPTSIPALYELLKPYAFVPKQYVGFNVGNPFNLPFQFSGSWSYVANGTTVEYC